MHIKGTCTYGNTFQKGSKQWSRVGVIRGWGLCAQGQYLEICLRGRCVVRWRLCIVLLYDPETHCAFVYRGGARDDGYGSSRDDFHTVYLLFYFARTAMLGVPR